MISFVDPFYSAGLAPDQLKPGLEFLFYLDDRPCPPGFPPGTVFLPIEGAYDVVQREGEVLAMLRMGLSGEFDRRSSLQQGHLLRFPDRLEVSLLVHSPKQPSAGETQRERILLGLAKDGERSMITLAHLAPVDQEESWESRRWGAYSVQFDALSDEGAPVIVVRRIDVE